MSASDLRADKAESSLVFPQAVPQRAVDLCKLPELESLVLIAPFLDRNEQLLDHLGGLADLLVGVACDQDVEVVVIIGEATRAFLASFTVLCGPFASDGNLGASLLLHLLLRQTPRPNNETNKIVVRILLDGDVNLLGLLEGNWLKVCRRTEGWVDLLRFVHEHLSLSNDFVFNTLVSGVGAVALPVIARKR